jgi:hypothetical protein
VADVRVRREEERMVGRWIVILVFAASVVGCGGGSDAGGGPADPVDPGGNPPPPPPPPPAFEEPVTLGEFTFWSVDQGLSATIHDVSPDAAGNVYVAGGDAVFAKRRDDPSFIRFEAADAGLTTDCNEAGTEMCPVVSVAGAAAGTAVVGFKGVGTDGDQDPEWQIDSGGADLVAFDGTSLSRTRHVWVAGVPHQMCEDHSAPPCALGDAVYERGRRKARQILRIAVNHRTGGLDAGDVWLGGTHSTLSGLLANASRRGWRDLTPEYPGYEATKDVWEHDHPAITDGRTGAFLTGSSSAIAVDPLTGDPWAANEFRLVTKPNVAKSGGYDVQMWPRYAGWDKPAESFLDIWPDSVPDDIGQFDAFDPAWMDATSSLSFCPDGTLWAASSLHGLARITIDRAALATEGVFASRETTVSVQHVDLPPGTGNNASAVACDADGSVWIGLGWGGFMRRFPNGGFEPGPLGGPAFVRASPVHSIQIDRSASPRIVYFAHVATARGDAGGVTAYRGR